jgi:hypothetical protein
MACEVLRGRTGRYVDSASISLEDWNLIFTNAPATMAPFLQIGTAISGAGTTFTGAIYVHPQHTRFTILPAASIVGTTRGKCINVILAPCNPPQNTYLGRLAALLPEIGGVASFLTPRTDDGSAIVGQVNAGFALVAEKQKEMGYDLLDAVQCFERLHQLLGLRKTIPGTVRTRFSSHSHVRMPTSLLMEGKHGTEEKCPSGTYTRGFMFTHVEYAAASNGMWRNMGYRAADLKQEF